MNDREQKIADRRRELEQLLSLRADLSEQYPDEISVRVIVVDELIYDCLAEIKRLEES